MTQLTALTAMYASAFMGAMHVRAFTGINYQSQLLTGLATF
jgi:hypothetical protein